MGRTCIKDHRPEHSLGRLEWVNGCAQCELEREGTVRFVSQDPTKIREAAAAGRITPSKGVELIRDIGKPQVVIDIENASSLERAEELAGDAPPQHRRAALDAVEDKRVSHEIKAIRDTAKLRGIITDDERSRLVELMRKKGQRRMERRATETAPTAPR